MRAAGYHSGESKSGPLGAGPASRQGFRVGFGDDGMAPRISRKDREVMLAALS